MPFPVPKESLPSRLRLKRSSIRKKVSAFLVFTTVVAEFLTYGYCPGQFAAFAGENTPFGVLTHPSFRSDQKETWEDHQFARPSTEVVAGASSDTGNLRLDIAPTDPAPKVSAPVESDRHSALWTPFEEIAIKREDGLILGTSRVTDATAWVAEMAGATTLTAQSTTASPPSSETTVRGVTDDEVRFGMVAPFTGPAKELGRQMMIGINAAFSAANDAGGVAGRRVKLITKDDGYEPARTAEAMQQLREDAKVFGYLGNVGTPTTAVALPVALKNKMLFFGAFTGANILRPVPPDRYVFNFRPSYAEETEAVVRYLVTVRNLKANNIAVFAQQDAYGDAGFEGVSRALRALGQGSSGILRMGYVRNSVDVNGAVAQLLLHRRDIRAVVMVATYRAAAKFIEKTRPDFPGIIYTNVSFVGSSALAEELMLLGPTFADNVIVTQTVPAIDGFSSAVLEYKSTTEKYFPGEAPDFVAFEGYIDAKILLEGLRRAGRRLNTETLVESLEATRGFELGLGAPISFTPSEHQGSHKVWGTRLNRLGRYMAIDLD